MAEKRHLRVFLNPDMEPAGEVPAPTPNQVLYAAPNRDRKPKSCESCGFWLASEEQCLIHTEDTIVTPGMVCGYHIEGKPLPALPKEPVLQLQQLEPYQTGLRNVPASCVTCRFFEPRGKDQGSCRALVDPEIGESSAIVEALGACTRWEGSDD